MSAPVLSSSAGPFVITLSSNPAHPRVGRTELSVAVQASANHQPVQNAQVLLHLRRPRGASAEILEFVLPAKQKDNQYVAATNLPSEGKWPVRIDVRRGRDEASVSGVLNVAPAESPLVNVWPFLIAAVVLALVLAIKLRLRRGYASRK